ncbi:hypothetical protein [Microbacterium sp. A84]|uniref:hypothetical protein n=1 Tax=Microbacterium sp. A84 TaxID=3450715 RepID=UPI003F424786
MATPISRDESSHRGQIKSRERVRDLAEVYTHKREVDAMLNLVPDMFPNAERPGDIDKKFLEPACGSGNFLEEILTRKLEFVTTAAYGTGATFEHRTLRALASIYAIDINDENVEESRDRLRSLVASHIDMELNTKPATEGFVAAVDAILNTNILHADSLADVDSITFVDYHPSRGSTFIREWSPMQAEAETMGLFSMFETRRDETPVHYTTLSSMPEPTTAGAVK